MIKALKVSKDKLIPTPWMGARCAEASIRVNQAALAYQFWQMLVKDKEKWDDEEQRWLRTRISRAVQREIQDRIIPSHRGEQMIRDLGEMTHEREISGQGRLGR